MGSLYKNNEIEMISGQLRATNYSPQ